MLRAGIGEVGSGRGLTVPFRNPIHNMSAPDGKGESSRHARYRRKTEADRIRNTRQWKRLVPVILKRDPVCCDPVGQHRGQAIATRTVHHIEPLHASPELAFVKDNLVGLCFSCHSSLEQIERKGTDTRDIVRAARESLRNFTAFGDLEPILGQDRPKSERKLRECRSFGNGRVYCATLRATRDLKCAGCNHL